VLSFLLFSTIVRLFRVLLSFSERKAFFGTGETLRSHHIANHLFLEGTVPVPPNRPCALRLCSDTVSGVIRSRGDATAARGKVLPAVAKKSVEKNILRSSSEPIFFMNTGAGTEN